MEIVEELGGRDTSRAFIHFASRLFVSALHGAAHGLSPGTLARALVFRAFRHLLVRDRHLLVGPHNTPVDRA